MIDVMESLDYSSVCKLLKIVARRNEKHTQSFKRMFKPSTVRKTHDECKQRKISC